MFLRQANGFGNRPYSRGFPTILWISVLIILAMRVCNTCRYLEVSCRTEAAPAGEKPSCRHCGGTLVLFNALLGAFELADSVRQVVPAGIPVSVSPAPGHRERYRMECACAFCGARRPQKKCGRCKAVRYCNEECQTADWGSHRQFCGVVRELATSETRGVPG